MSSKNVQSRVEYGTCYHLPCIWAFIPLENRRMGSPSCHPIFPCLPSRELLHRLFYFCDRDHSSRDHLCNRLFPSRGSSPFCWRFNGLISCELVPSFRDCFHSRKRITCRHAVKKQAVGDDDCDDGHDGSHRLYTFTST